MKKTKITSQNETYFKTAKKNLLDAGHVVPVFIIDSKDNKQFIVPFVLPGDLDPNRAKDIFMTKTAEFVKGKNIEVAEITLITEGWFIKVDKPKGSKNKKKVMTEAEIAVEKVLSGAVAVRNMPNRQEAVTVCSWHTNGTKTMRLLPFTKKGKKVITEKIVIAKGKDGQAEFNIFNPFWKEYLTN